MELHKTTAPVPLFQGQLVRRYKRFLADIKMADDSEITVHCPNTGSMKNCVVPMSSCWCSSSDNIARKYAHTLEIVTTPSGHLAGVNTGRANGLVEIAINTGIIKELQGYDRLRREVVYGNEKSRVDFVLEKNNQQCFVEVKNVTLMEAEGEGLFPDAVSERGTKHLRELMQMVHEGHRAVLFFCVQHTGIEWVSPADAIDPLYGKTLREALAAGVEVIAYRADIKPAEGIIALTKKIPIRVE